MTADTSIDPVADERPPIVCPKCNSPMEKVTFQNIEVDRCTGCRGLWFDLLERENLAAMEGSEAIDPAPAQTEVPVAGRVNCPVCHAPMMRLTDPAHRDLWYESCNVCFGVFYDAGEFREHKEHHAMGFFRELFSGKPRK